MSRYFEKMGIGDGIEGGNEFNNFALTKILRYFSAGQSIIEYIFLKAMKFVDVVFRVFWS